ncbi:MAG: pantoate--beta-alanine ligase [Proteobacteria bacterium]|nr:pantoate--beta-alanine ligase [Pseudomonadota bacterium]
MKIIDSVATLLAWKQSLFQGASAHSPVDQPLVFVPTMGSLHLGHTALIQQARKLAGSSGKVVVSIFVNPLQFDQQDDYDHYPRDLAKDISLLKKLGVDVLFIPDQKSFPPKNTLIELKKLNHGPQSLARPGHLTGVCTIIMKFFVIISPTDVFFGEKDYEQLLVIRGMVRDYELPIHIHAVATVREPSGLAYSSRNQRLSHDSRTKKAPLIFQVLRKAKDMWQEHQIPSSELIEYVTGQLNNHHSMCCQYVVILSGDDLTTIEKPVSGETILFVSVCLEGVYLIDHIKLTSQETKPLT